MNTNSGLATVVAAVHGDDATNADFQRGVKQGATAERGRIKTVLSSPEARGRESFASIFAFSTDMTAQAAIAELKNMPSAPKSSRLDGRVPTPKVDAYDGGSGQDASPWARVTARANQRMQPGAISGRSLLARSSDPQD